MGITLYSDTRDATFGNNVLVVTWAGMPKGDTGAPFKNPGWADRSVQISGTFDSATVVFEGSNDGVTYFTLSDPQGNAISKTTAALEQVSEMTLWVRPSIASTGGTTAVNVILVARRS